jgi:small GTP-binding protein
MDVKLQLWDTTGQERFRSMAKNFFRGAKGAFFVFDLTDKASLEVLKTWIAQCTLHAGEDITKMILANKVDLVEQRAVEIEELLEIAKENEAIFYEVSAKTGANVKEAFGEMAETITKKMIMKKSKKKERGFSLLDKSPLDKDETSKQEKGCCNS